MTVTELLALIDIYYISAETAATKVMLMNICQRDLERYFQNTRMVTFLTVADTDAYALPSGITDISQIQSLGVSWDTTPDDRYSYDKFEPAYANDYPKAGGRSFYQRIDSAGVKWLVLYPVPTVDDYVVSVNYTKPFTALAVGSPSASPEFDSAYHELLVLYACAKIASFGSAPDHTQATAFAQQFDDGILDLIMRQAEKEIPDNAPGSRQWRSNRSHVHISTTGT